MKQILCIALLLLVVGCGNEPVKSFNGFVDRVTLNEMEMDCSSAVKEKLFADEIEPVGYLCTVKITEETKIFNIDDEEIDVVQFSRLATPDSPQYIEVTLVKAKEMNESGESREGLIAETIEITEN